MVGKPRIFIHMHYMEIGGAERSLLGLLNAIDYEKYDVDLFIQSHRGDLMSSIPNKVNLLPEIKKYSVLEAPITQCLKYGFFDVALMRILYKVVKKIYYWRRPDVRDDDDYFRSSMTTWLMPRINPRTEYDLAISYLTPHKIVLEKVKAIKKAAWVHTDYSSLKIDRKLPLLIWGKYDHIVSISKDITRTFTMVFPSLADKIKEIENILSPEFVKRKATLFTVDTEMKQKGVKLLSIGRFCVAKNYDNVPDIAKKIIEAGYDDFCWYIIGFGGTEELVRQKIVDAGVQDHVILLGKKDNPYPYIKACDIYVQPSRYEGKSVTVREAQILCKPVVITNYATAKSQIQDGVDGVIVPMDNAGCSKGLVSFIHNVQLQEKIKSYLSANDYGNESEANKIDLLL